MNLKNIALNEKFPEIINVVIEISMGSEPVKYEIDKDSGLLNVDRFMQTAMFYPCNYGFIPNSLGGDGDPLDVLVHCPYPLLPGSMILCRPIGMLVMEDESGQDEKILSVPISKINPDSEKFQEYRDLSELTLGRINNFFENYKKLEKNKWVKIIGWKNKESTLELIRSSATKI